MCSDTHRASLSAFPFCFPPSLCSYTSFPFILHPVLPHLLSRSPSLPELDFYAVYWLIGSNGPLFSELPGSASLAFCSFYREHSPLRDLPLVMLLTFFSSIIGNSQCCSKRRSYMNFQKHAYSGTCVLNHSFSAMNPQRSSELLLSAL